jgi:hypothetical protein
VVQGWFRATKKILLKTIVTQTEKKITLLNQFFRPYKKTSIPGDCSFQLFKNWSLSVWCRASKKILLTIGGHTGKKYLSNVLDHMKKTPSLESVS